MTMIRSFLFAGAVACAALLSGNAPDAGADPDGYIAELRAGGVPVITTGPAIQAGYTACSMLKGGADFDQVAHNTGQWFSGIWGSLMVTAAQHQLCPETLR
jgi:hypothetical protein